MRSLFPRLIRLLPIAALAAAPAVLAQGAKSFPDKAARVIVGYSPGGLPDTIARLIGQKRSECWGQLLKSDAERYSKAVKISGAKVE
jgi:tripartite-type tricarboxylate transporter receptor subunit TctC